jgi:hypothetical protein
MPKVDQSWPCLTRLARQTSRSQEVSAGCGDGRALQWTPPERDEQVILGNRELRALAQVALQGSAWSGMERHQTTFAALGLANHQPIGGDVVEM